MRVVIHFLVGDGHDHHIAALPAAYGVAVGRRFRNHLQAELSAGAGPVVDGELLAEFFTGFVADQPRQHVARIAGARRNDDADGSVGIVLRLRARAHGSE